jgi:hypothetical protein
MGLRFRQIRRQLGLASAMALCVLLPGAVIGNTNGSAGLDPPERELRFARLMYNGNFMDRGGFGRGESWTTDAPDAEYHLLQGIRRLTRVDTIDPDRALLDFDCKPVPSRDKFVACAADDPNLSEYPFLYGVEVGRWYLNDIEAKGLREYLERGGFLMVDDFHGEEQWEGFMESMRRVFPEREVVEIPDNHEVFHVLYDLDQKTQIPGRAAMMNGGSCEQCDYGGATPHWRGVFDDSGRLMVAINFNMDLGEAWEHADDADYPQPLTALAYRFAISYALYAMTH